MVLPIFIAQSVEKFRRRIGHTGIAQRPDAREVADDLRKGCEPALRMIHRTLAAHFPNLTREREALEFRTARPPLLPQPAEKCARRRIKRREFALIEEARDAKEQRGRGVLRRAEQPQREALREQCERQLVRLVAERGRKRLIERFVGAVQLREARERGGFFPHAELR